MYNNTCKVERLSFEKQQYLTISEKKHGLLNKLFAFILFSLNLWKGTNGNEVGGARSLFNVRTHRAEKHSHVYQLFGFAT